MQAILFQNRKIGGVFNEALLLIDRIDCLMPKSYAHEFYTYKFEKKGCMLQSWVEKNHRLHLWCSCPFPPLPEKWTTTRSFRALSRVGLTTESELRQTWATMTLPKLTQTVQPCNFQAEQASLQGFGLGTTPAIKGSRIRTFWRVCTATTFSTTKQYLK